MSVVTRRVGLLSLAGALAACATQSGPNPPSGAATLSQVYASFKSGVAALVAQEPALMAINSTLLPDTTKATIISDISQAQLVLNAVQATATANAQANALDQALGFLNLAISLAGPALPPPYGVLLETINALAPLAEAVITAALGSATSNTLTGATLRSKAGMPVRIMSLDKANALFKSYGG